MTLKQLQRYLETEKWRETAKRGYDLCGAYARCAHCNRYDEYPCAEAHNRYMASQDFSAEAEGLLPEPPIKRIFGAEIAEEKEAAAPVKEQSVRHENPVVIKSESPVAAKPESTRIPIQRFVRERLQVQTSPAEPALEKREANQTPLAGQHTAAREHVLTRGRIHGDETRLLVLRKRNS